MASPIPVRKSVDIMWIDFQTGRVAVNVLIMFSLVESQDAPKNWATRRTRAAGIASTAAPMMI